jgi:NhaP-type Na+/H+ or K+/H+ antiporter
MIPLLIFGVIVFAFGLVSERLERTIITSPMVFTLAGLLLAFSFPSQFHLDFDIKAYALLGKIALALVLFTDATHVGVRDVLRRATIPSRLLGIAMPLVIIAGAAVAIPLFPQLPIWEAAILATILAPTDAGLGQTIMSSPRVPSRIRAALNVEAGLNDGLAIPFLMLFVGLARVDQPFQEYSWVLFTLRQVGLGLLAGLIIGGVGGWLLQRASKRGWITDGFQQLCLLVLALFAFFGAQPIGANEFIVVFVAGLVVKLSFEDAGQEMLRFSEAWGQLPNFLVFFVFGMVAAASLSDFGREIWLYAVLSLTVVRILPVLLSLIGTRLHLSSSLFVGWFGPRGLASIVLGLILVQEQAGILGQSLIELTVVATVLVSVFAHGFTAAPGINLYARRVAAMPDGAPEKQEAPFESARAGEGSTL